MGNHRYFAGMVVCFFIALLLIFGLIYSSLPAGQNLGVENEQVWERPMFGQVYIAKASYIPEMEVIEVITEPSPEPEIPVLIPREPTTWVTNYVEPQPTITNEQNVVVENLVEVTPTPMGNVVEYSSGLFGTLDPLPPMPWYNTPVPLVYDKEYLLSYTLDEMWDLAESMGLVDKVPRCQGLPSIPFVTWEMAERASGLQTSDREHPDIKMSLTDVSGIIAEGGASFPSQGIIQVNEEVVKGKLVELYYQGNLHACLENSKPTVYGSGLYDFYNWLEQYIIS